MFFSVDLVAKDLVQDDVLGRFKEVLGDLRVGFSQFGDEFFGFQAFGDGGAVVGAAGAVFCKFAGALEEAEAVVVAPAEDVGLADEVHGADELHSFEIGAAEFWHHGLVLAGVEHAHEDGLNDVVVVVAQCDLVAAPFLSEAVEVAAAHAGAEVAGGFFYCVDGVEDLGVEELDRYAEEPGVVFNDLPVRLVVAGIHAQKDEGEGKLVVPFELLKELCHQHGVLAS